MLLRRAGVDCFSRGTLPTKKLVKVGTTGDLVSSFAFAARGGIDCFSRGTLPTNKLVKVGTTGDLVSSFAFSARGGIDYFSRGTLPTKKLVTVGTTGDLVSSFAFSARGGIDYFSRGTLPTKKLVTVGTTFVGGGSFCNLGLPPLHNFSFDSTVSAARKPRLGCGSGVGSTCSATSSFASCGWHPRLLNTNRDHTVEGLQKESHDCGGGRRGHVTDAILGG